MASLHEKWLQIPQFVRFNISGVLGTILFERMNNYIFYSLQHVQHEYKSAAVFGFSYLISCLWQHALHRHLVFGSEGSRYLPSLLAFYATYAFSIVASPAVNGVLTAGLGFSMELAYYLTLGIIGVLNYFTAGAALGSKNGSVKDDNTKLKG